MLDAQDTLWQLFIQERERVIEEERKFLRVTEKFHEKAAQFDRLLDATFSQAEQSGQLPVELRQRSEDRAHDPCSECTLHALPCLLVG
jgi:hypothetical protein